jgi:malic enzyme
MLQSCDASTCTPHHQILSLARRVTQVTSALESGLLRKKEKGVCRMKFPCFADDYQGLSAAVLAATLGAIPETGISLKDHRIVLLGSGPHRVCIAEMIASAIAFESRGMASEARQNIFLFDNDGLVTTESPHAERDDEEMREILLYSKDMPNSKDINEVHTLPLDSCLCHVSTSLPDPTDSAGNIMTMS